MGQGVYELSYPIQQFSLLRERDSNSLQGIILLDNNNQPHVIPDASRKLANGLYLYTADRLTGTMAGYSIQYENSVSFSPFFEKVKIVNSSRFFKRSRHGEFKLVAPEISKRSSKSPLRTRLSTFIHKVASSPTVPSSTSI